MKNFVFVSKDFKDAWKLYVKNPNLIDQWEVFDEDFIYDLKFIFEEEEHWLKKMYRPASWYLNDKLGEKDFVFKMNNDFYPIVPYEYTDNLPDFAEILLNRAREIASFNQVIDVLYSGGIDSACILWALSEVCSRDQVNVIVHDDTCFKLSSKLYENFIRHGQITYSFGNIYSIADIKNHIFTTGCEADRLFGSTGYPYNRKVNKERFTYEDDYDFHHKQWWDITRYTLLTQSFRFLQNITCRKFPMFHYQPFFLCPQIERFAINEHHDHKIVWHKNHWSKDSEFLKTKMAIRNFIAKFDKDYAYSMIKTDMPIEVQTDNILPLNNNYNVLAITGDGTVVNRKNIMKYMKREYLTL